MAIGVRDYLENLGHTVGYDQKSGDVLVKNEKGKMTSIGNESFKLGSDNRYYAESESDILSALSKSGISPKIGFSPVRNTLSPENSISYNEKTGQLYVNGRDYNVDGKNLINIGGTVYGEDNFIKSLEKGEYENKYASLQDETLKKLLGSKYEGYNPKNDKNYQMAYKSFMQDAKADMGERGLISDSLSTYYAAQGAEKLMPEFAALDYERYLNEQENLKDALDILGTLDENSRQAYKDNAAIRLEESRLMHERDGDIAERIENENKALREEENIKTEHQNKTELLEKEYQLKEQNDARNFEYEKELKRLQSDLDISKAQAQAYYKMIYG